MLMLWVAVAVIALSGAGANLDLTAPPAVLVLAPPFSLTQLQLKAKWSFNSDRQLSFALDSVHFWWFWWLSRWLSLISGEQYIYMGAASNYDGARKKRGSELSAQCQTYSIFNPISKLKLGTAKCETYSIVGNLSFSRRREIYVYCVKHIFNHLLAYFQKWPLKAIFVHLNLFLGDAPCSLGNTQMWMWHNAKLSCHLKYQAVEISVIRWRLFYQHFLNCSCPIYFPFDISSDAIHLMLCLTHFCPELMKW